MRIAPGLTTVNWRKSSYSNNVGGDCVEVADGIAGVVPVRDSKAPARGSLAVPATSWSSLTDALKRA